jgi:hypothetical protein
LGPGVQIDVQISVGRRELGLLPFNVFDETIALVIHKI